MKDLTLPIEDGILNVRVGAIILKNGKYLMIGNKNADYLYSVGGRIHFLETAEEAVVREVYEETGIHMEIDRLGFIHQNFFNLEKKGRVHELSFFYYMKVPADFEPQTCDCTGDGDQQYYHWVSMDDDVKAYPEFFKEELKHPEHTVKVMFTNDLKD